MKKILTLAVFLLNLLSLTEVSAQNYSSETGKTCTGTGILCDAMHSEADIYTIVTGESEHEFNDYSEYGDFSLEVVTSDGEHIITTMVTWEVQRRTAFTARVYHTK